jgi:hypothetical protein
MSRICELQGIGGGTLYRRIDWIYERCQSFARQHEHRLLDVAIQEKLYVAVDRQYYTLNWSRRKDKRNVVIHALGSADLSSGYVFGMNINFDGSVDPTETASAAEAGGDYAVSYPYRRHARLWLPADYENSLKAAGARAARRAPKNGVATLADGISTRYSDSEAREDIESAELMTVNEQLPKNGMLIHNEYTLYAHFFLLRQLFSGVSKVRFFLDQEPGIRAACLTAFHKEIQQRKCDAFFVTIGKDKTVDEKRRAIRESREAFEDMQSANPKLADWEVQVLMVKNEMARAAQHGRWQDRWVRHPVPNSSEPEKAMCYLTDLKDFDPDHMARLYLKCSLHPIDRFFMQVRRRLSLLERPLGSARNPGRVWNGYSAYRPENVEKVLGIFRVYYNYCLKTGKEKATPAMRLGLASRAYAPGELL